MYKIKHHLRYENKVNENKVLPYCEAPRYMWNNKKSLFSFMSNLQTYYNFKLDLKKKWTNTQEASG